MSQYGTTTNIIYCWTNLVNGKKYIGLTACKRGLKARYRHHKNDANNINSPRYDKPLQCAIRKYGIENFKLEVLAIEEDYEKLNSLEVYYIAHFRTTEDEYGYNFEAGGNCEPLTEKVKQRMSEVKYKMYHENEDYRSKMDNNLAKGTRFKAGKENPSYGTGGTYIATHVETGEVFIFNALIDAVNNGFLKSEVTRAVNGKCHKSKKHSLGNYYKGYYWERVSK